MLNGLRQFIADDVSPHAHDNRSFDDSGYRLAATALLIHVISLDGAPSSEITWISSAVAASRYPLSSKLRLSCAWGETSSAMNWRNPFNICCYRSRVTLIELPEG